MGLSLLCPLQNSIKGLRSSAPERTHQGRKSSKDKKGFYQHKCAVTWRNRLGVLRTHPPNVSGSVGNVSVWESLKVTDGTMGLACHKFRWRKRAKCLQSTVFWGKPLLSSSFSIRQCIRGPDASGLMTGRIERGAGSRRRRHRGGCGGVLRSAAGCGNPRQSGPQTHSPNSGRRDRPGRPGV